jgi:pilus assembly protein CpaB
MDCIVILNKPALYLSVVNDECLAQFCRKRMRAIGFVIAIVFAIAAFFLVMNVMGGSEKTNLIAAPKAADVESVQVMVAAKVIEMGDVITDDVLKPQSWPKHLVVDGFVSTPEQSSGVIGRVARSNFAIGEPINMARLSNPEDPSFIAAALPSGMRMATISSDAIAGLAGFVYPGDRVDVVVTSKVKFNRQIVTKTGFNDTSVAQTLVSNVKVLAVNQRPTIVTPEEQKNMDKRERLPSSISLEVTLEDAQRMRLAQETGYLSLALRSLADKGDVMQRPVLTTFQDVVSPELAEAAALYQGGESDGKKGVVSLVRGNEKTEVEVPETKEELSNQSNDETVE